MRDPKYKIKITQEDKEVLLDLIDYVGSMLILDIWSDMKEHEKQGYQLIKKAQEILLT